MAGRTKIDRAKEIFKKYNGKVFGAETLKNIVRANLTGNENEVYHYLDTLRSVGIIAEVQEWRFLVNTESEIKGVGDNETINQENKQ